MTRLSPTGPYLVNTARAAGRVHLPDCPWLAGVKVPGHGPLPAYYVTMYGREVPAGKPCCSYCLKGTVV